MCIFLFFFFLKKPGKKGHLSVFLFFFLDSLYVLSSLMEPCVNLLYGSQLLEEARERALRRGRKWKSMWEVAPGESMGL